MDRANIHTAQLGDMDSSLSTHMGMHERWAITRCLGLVMGRHSTIYSLDSFTTRACQYDFTLLMFIQSGWKKYILVEH